MDPRLIGALASMVYIAATCGLATARHALGLVCTAVAVVIHAAFLYPSAVTAVGVDISLVNAALASIVFAVLVFGRWRGRRGVK